MSDDNMIFNPPPGWPKPPPGWRPPRGWEPDPTWPDPPDGWKLWISTDLDNTVVTSRATPSAEASSTSGPPADDQRDSRLLLLEEELRVAREQLAAISERPDLVELSDERVLQEVGVYRYHHPLETAVAYKDQLKALTERISQAVKAGRAIDFSNMFTFDNSLAKGRRMTRDLGKLMLRAYNAEVDNCLRSLRVGNVHTAKKRIEASREAIRRLGSLMEMQISDEFHALRLDELELTADFLMKKQEEKELAREERARLREQRRVERELAQEREQLDKERAHLLNAIASLQGSGQQDAELEAKLASIDEAIEQNDYRAANIRAGYVYIISNIGAFGPEVVKIGLTRRLEPHDRVAELSGAAVPFRFDVHGLFFSEDAVTLENELHKHFASRRVNQANMRKEFFFVTPSEVRDVLVERMGNLLEFRELAEATEYYQSRGSWPTAASADRDPRAE